MRLLNTRTLKLEDFVQNIPHYVILSHTWGNGEVTFGDIEQPYAKTMPGWEKIAQCCNQAALDGFEYAWIDTCCIDKRSSAELSEAINSMFDYYWSAEICYAYLSDVPSHDDHVKPGSEFERSRWFKRGWTLQELVAPAVVEFYGSDWRQIGTKSSLMDSIRRATNIEGKFLLDREKLDEASVARKFSWASSRETTRVEDMAYCLLGLLGVNMPLLYGEGKKSFRRLQLELLKQTNEHTLLSWVDLAPEETEPKGALSGSPLGFRLAGNISSRDPWKASSHQMSNKGLRIKLPCIPHPLIQNRVAAILNCQFEERGPPAMWPHVGIWLEHVRGNQYRRILQQKLERIGVAQAEAAQIKDIYLVEGILEAKANAGPKLLFKMKVISTPADAAYQLGWVAKGLEDRMSTSSVEPTSIVPEHAAVQDENGYCGMVFGEGKQGFLVAFGRRKRRIWLDIIPNIQAENARDALKKVYEAATTGQWVFGRHSVTHRLQNGSVVSLWAKKKRVEQSILWTLTVDVKASDGQGGPISVMPPKPFALNSFLSKTEKKRSAKLMDVAHRRPTKQLGGWGTHHAGGMVGIFSRMQYRMKQSRLLFARFWK